MLITEAAKKKLVYVTEAQYKEYFFFEEYNIKVLPVQPTCMPRTEI